ncbi:Mitochondrial phosphate carrier protein 1 mitochondrial [Euphorbia peplus]|nr:Mitochondrial phosphate carrier protein 1 mitochondrial [Euphorbia peplus]
MNKIEKQRGRIQEYKDGAGGYYYGVCAASGMLSAGFTHLTITPLDVLKVNLQVNPVKYNNGIYTCFITILREQGRCAFWRGWSSKLFGYGIQGGCRFGLYEYFKNLYSHLLPNTNTSFLFFMSSASAEIYANLALCPFEAIKIRLQTHPHFAKGLLDGLPKLYASEGFFGFYRGLVPLLGRNLPFSMVMFSTFEHSVDFLYRNVIQQRKEECSKAQQLGVTCLAGYTAGSVGSFISNPADNIVACLYNRKADSIILAVKKIGFSNLFTRSLPLRIMLVGPVVTLQWFLYDSIKVLSGLPTSGGVRSEVVVDEHSNSRFIKTEIHS